MTAATASSAREEEGERRGLAEQPLRAPLHPQLERGDGEDGEGDDGRRCWAGGLGGRRRRRRRWVGGSTTTGRRRRWAGRDGEGERERGRDPRRWLAVLRPPHLFDYNYHLNLNFSTFKFRGDFGKKFAVVYFSVSTFITLRIRI